MPVVAVVVAAPAAPRREGAELTGQKSAEVVVPAGDQDQGPGRTERRGETEESVLLVLVAVIAAIPRTRASCREETVRSVEHRS